MLPSGTLNLKLPSRSVTVPLEVPFSITVAPMTPSPVSSMTVPDASVCAYSNVLAKMSVILSRNLFSLSICVLFLVNTFV